MSEVLLQLSLGIWVSIGMKRHLPACSAARENHWHFRDRRGTRGGQIQKYVLYFLFFYMDISLEKYWSVGHRPAINVQLYGMPVGIWAIRAHT